MVKWTTLNNPVFLWKLLRSFERLHDLLIWLLRSLVLSRGARSRCRGITKLQRSLRGSTKQNTCGLCPGADEFETPQIYLQHKIVSSLISERSPLLDNLAVEWRIKDSNLKMTIFWNELILSANYAKNQSGPENHSKTCSFCFRRGVLLRVHANTLRHRPLFLTPQLWLPLKVDIGTSHNWSVVQVQRCSIKWLWFLLGNEALPEAGKHTTVYLARSLYGAKVFL